MAYGLEKISSCGHCVCVSHWSQKKEGMDCSMHTLSLHSLPPCDGQSLNDRLECLGLEFCFCWRSSSRGMFSAGALLACETYPRSSLTAVCINWMYSSTNSADISWPAEFSMLLADMIEQSVVCPASQQSLPRRVQTAAESSSF